MGTANDDDLIESLRELLAACSTCNKHEQAIVLIDACIEAGQNTKAGILGTLGLLGWNMAHARVLLVKSTGNAPTRHRWSRSAKRAAGARNRCAIWAWLPARDCSAAALACTPTHRAIFTRGPGPGPMARTHGRRARGRVRLVACGSGESSPTSCGRPCCNPAG